MKMNVSQITIFRSVKFLRDGTWSRKVEHLVSHHRLNSWNLSLKSKGVPFNEFGRYKEKSRQNQKHFTRNSSLFGRQFRTETVTDGPPNPLHYENFVWGFQKFTFNKDSFPSLIRKEELRPGILTNWLSHTSFTTTWSKTVSEIIWPSEVKNREFYEWVL